MLVFEKNNANDVVIRFGNDSKKLAKKLKKSKNQIFFKSKKLAKSRKKLSKSRTSSKFDAIESGISFLTSRAKKTFDCL